MSALVKWTNTPRPSKTVKNLGWLSRHSKEATQVVLESIPNKSEGILTVFGTQQGYCGTYEWMFECHFESFSVMYEWYKRQRNLMALPVTLKNASFGTQLHRERTESDNLVRVYRYDLWGNMKDGFDNNNTVYIKSEQLPGRQAVSKTELLKIARDEFEGRYLARTENQSLPMQRRHIDIEWRDEQTYEITYKGQWIGELRIGQFA